MSNREPPVRYVPPSQEDEDRYESFFQCGNPTHPRLRQAVIKRMASELPRTNYTYVMVPCRADAQGTLYGRQGVSQCTSAQADRWSVFRLETIKSRTGREGWGFKLESHKPSASFEWVSDHASEDAAVDEAVRLTLA